MATALEQYVRLESLGLWKESPGAQKREVVVSFGRISLVLSDNNDSVLTHWHLLAINRLNPNRHPALYSPGSSSSEIVEVSDPDMIEAIEYIRSSVPRPGTRRTRLLRIVVAAVAAGAAAVGLFWLPGAIEERTLRVTPPARVQAVGDSLFREMAHVTGPECRSAVALPVLAKFAERLAPDEGISIHIVDLDGRDSAFLLGGHVLLDRSLLDWADGLDIAAGHALVEIAASRERDLFRELVDRVGTWHTVAFLMGRSFPPASLERHVRFVLEQPRQARDPDFLRTLVADAGLTVEPLPQAIRPGDSRTGAGRTAEDGQTPPPVIDAVDWAALRATCGS